MESTRTAVTATVPARLPTRCTRATAITVARADTLMLISGAGSTGAAPAQRRKNENDCFHDSGRADDRRALPLGRRGGEAGRNDRCYVHFAHGARWCRRRATQPAAY